ncbi:MFS transporter [Pseudoclavibacter terrae]|uniref:MFS transporter n=1 Tax=Pseudoclavibacter terrae TaxID=1530195 RepID=UPI003CC76007
MIRLFRPEKGADRSGRYAHSAAIITLTLALITLTTRAPTASIAPVINQISSETSLTPTILSLLTSVPLACFLIAAPIAPWLQARFGLSVVLMVSLAGASAGTVIRSLPGTWSLGLGTLLLGFAVAVVSVLTPSLITGFVGRHNRWYTSVYTASLSLGPALATGLAVPLANAFGDSWRLACGSLAVLPLLGLSGWILVHPEESGARRSHKMRTSRDDALTSQRRREGLSEVLLDPSAWIVTGYLAFTSMLFYAMLAWLPTILIDSGEPPATAGAYASLVNLTAIPAAFAAPGLLRKVSPRWLAPLSAPLPFALGAAVLASVPSQPIPALLLLGLGQGASVGISYGLVLAMSRSPQHSTSLSSMSQTFGVALAAVGPLAAASIHEASGGWSLVLWSLCAVAVLQSVVGVCSTSTKS